MQLLYTKEEVLKPKVSSGIFCILFAAVGKKYAVGDIKRNYCWEKWAVGDTFLMPKLLKNMPSETKENDL